MIDKVSYFLAFCIEQYKASHNMKGETVAELFRNKGIDRYLVANYEVLHTQSCQWIVEEIDSLLQTSPISSET